LWLDPSRIMAIDSPLLVFDFPAPAGARQRFTQPVEVIVAREAAEVRPALRAVQRAAEAGLYAAGFVAYEAAPAFDPAFAVHSNDGLPLVWFGLFRAPETEAGPPPVGDYTLGEWRPATARATYNRHLAAVRAAIGRGDTYQVNYTMRMRAAFAGDAHALYERMRASQPAGYCAYLDIGRHQILSASPELFFHWRGRAITTRPMKGTAPRGRWLAEDRALAAGLAASEKNRAENLMIVDLLRNDLGRVAEIGSVAVPSLFAIERYRTVYQMTSTVTATARTDATLEAIFAALFPCGSITGAPKIETMKLIANLEPSPRGVYCGAIGMVAPGGEATFNVAIRTAVIDRERHLAEYGVGGGITWDSTAADEYAEALLKAAPLTAPWPAFELLETLRLDDGAYTLLDRHLARLAESAEYFAIPLAIDHAHATLEGHARAFPAESRRVRLLVAQDGAVRAESTPLVRAETEMARHEPPRAVAFARTPISQHDRWLFHKTTNRAVYDTRRGERPELYDVLLWNEEGEVTEFTTGNLVVELDGRRLTPPQEAGLLAGTLRAELLAGGEIRERTLARADVARAEKLWLINSVRGWVPVRLVP
jgi:para-aminobenzoate synthetase/4-amino-4-deoxychorismate lyase